MELSRLKTNFKAGTFFKKYKFVLLVIFIGIIFMLWPDGSSKKNTAAAASGTSVSAAEVSSAEALEKKLADAISRIEGAGRTTVVLTLKSDWQTIIAQDLEKERLSEKSGDSSRVEEREAAAAVKVDGSGGEQVVVLERLYPKYQGALVVCEGADDPGVRMDVLNAVSRLTGLGTDKISVSKMKSN